MLHFLYNVFIRLYYFAIAFSSLFHRKAQKAIEGRKRWRNKLLEWRKQHSGALIWIHCASLGEFEQGRPIIESLRKRFPKKKLLLTFFSPSGYEIRKNYTEVDGVFYLPFDLPKASSDFIEILNPESAIFVKYEFWANYFLRLAAKNIPLIMISVPFRADQHFFRLPNSFSRKILSCVRFYFLQNRTSQELLEKVCSSPSLVTGDTRFDRVIEIARNVQHHPSIEAFISGRKCVICGSSYPTEEEMLFRLDFSPKEVCFVIAPHEIQEERILQIERLFEGRTVRYSAIHEASDGKDILILNTMGMLSSIYRYGEVVVIGGGFGKGIHNTLEAAVYGKPLLFGPKYEKFEEARRLIEAKGAVSVRTKVEGIAQIKHWMMDESVRNSAGKSASDVVMSGAGSVIKIMETLVKQGYWTD